MSDDVAVAVRGLTKRFGDRLAVDGVEYHPGRRAIEELRISARALGLPREGCDEVLELVGLGDAAGPAPRRAGQRPRPRGGIPERMVHPLEPLVALVVFLGYVVVATVAAGILMRVRDV